MSMLPDRPQDAFVYNPKTEEVDPINLIATDRVKCLNCNRYFHNTMIEAHLLTHNNQQLVQRSVAPPVLPLSEDQRAMKLLNMNRLASPNSPTASNSKFDVSTEPIDVRTMTADQLPEPQYRRRQIELPLPHGAQPVGQNGAPVPFEGRRLRTHPNNEFTSINVPTNSIRERISVGDYYESVQLGQPQSISVVPGTINLKRNMNAATYVDKDDHVDPEKVSITEDFEPDYRPHTYRVTQYISQGQKLEKDPFSQTGQTRAERKKVESIIQVPSANRYLPVELPSRITTSRKRNTIFSNPPTTQPYSNLPASRYTNQNPTQAQSRIAPFARSIVYEHEADHRCPECSGFYCQTCKATFPPQCRMPYSQPHFLNRQYDPTISAANRRCRDCGGFYCPCCQATFPPECRRPHGEGQYNQYQVRTSNSGITPRKEKEF